MTWLILGLILFLGAHSTRIFADDWRTRTLAAWGEKPFKGVSALVSLVGFYALIVGYGEARLEPIVLWSPPIATRHISALLMLFASILLVAAHIPGNFFKVRLGHPMVLSVKVWAFFVKWQCGRCHFVWRIFAVVCFEFQSIACA